MFISGCQTTDSFLWSATKNKVTIYLLGVSHNIPSEFSSIPLHVQNKFDSSEVYVVEAILYPDQKLSVVSSNFKPDVDSLDLLDTIEADGFIDHQTKNQFLKLSPYELVQPAKIVIRENRKKHNDRAALENLSFVKGLDQQLFNIAWDKKIPVFGLEEPNSNASSWITYCNSNMHFQKILKSIKKESLREIPYKWSDNSTAEKLLNGDLDFFDTYFSLRVKLSEIDELSSDCSYQVRTVAWVKSLDNIVKKSKPKSKIFVAVGLAHLRPPKSLLELLEKEGYSIERITARSSVAN
jgi:uncharacterized protein YbaP (TraB family)